MAIIKKIEQAPVFAKVLLLFAWMCFLIPTDSYYSVYLLLGLAGLYCFAHEDKTAVTVLQRIFALLFSGMVALANYKLFTVFDDLPKIHLPLAVLLIALMLLAGYYLFLTLLGKLRTLSTAKLKLFKNANPRKVFWISFGIIAAINLLVLFIFCYPGTLTNDSLDEINQLMTNTYSNHHPFYFTLLIKAFVSLGLKIFNDMNAAVALYSVFQILVMAAIFAFAIKTMVESKMPKIVTILSFLFFALMPFNILYSFTFWKDVLFGGCILLFLVALYRYYNKIGNAKINTLFMIIGGLVFCLFRSNGMFAFLIFLGLFIILFRKQFKALCAIFTGVLIVAFIMKTPALKMLNITQPDSLESLSIPMQQVSRVIAYQNDLSEDETALVNNVISTDVIAGAYNPILHDPVKDAIRFSGNKKYFDDNKMAFAGLYVSLGLRHFPAYVEAWTEQTRGYWNGGYNYWRAVSEISDNNYGIEKAYIKRNDIVNKLNNKFEHIGFIQPLISIGLFNWVLIVLFYAQVERRNKFGVILTVPALALLLSLLIATPVFAEFRYVYYLFCIMPFLIAVLLNKEKSGAKAR